MEMRWGEAGEGQVTGAGMAWGCEAERGAGDRSETWGGSGGWIRALAQAPRGDMGQAPPCPHPSVLQTR